MKILVADDNEVMIDIIRIALEGIVDGEFLEANSKKTAIDLIKFSSDFDLVITSTHLTDGSGLEIFQHLLKEKLQIPTILLGSNLPEEYQDPKFQKKITCLNDPTDVKAFINIISNFVIGSSQTLADLPVYNYCKVRLDTLLKSGHLFNFDLFIRLSDQKFVKVLSKGDRFEMDDYSRYSAKKLTHLYLQKDDFAEFLKNFTKDIQSIMKTKSEQLTAEPAMDIVSSIHETLHDAIPTFGFKSELQQLAKTSIDLAITAINKDPELTDLLNHMFADETAYKTWHSTMLTFVACRLSNLMAWDSETTHYKLALASLLHDISLPDHNLASIQNFDELYSQNLSDKEIQLYNNHPQDAAQMVRQMKDFPGEVDFIVAQHHERPDGSGFPARINHTKISPLSSLFIIAHDMVVEIYRKDKDFDINDYLASKKDEYCSGYFKKVFKEIQEHLT